MTQICLRCGNPCETQEVIDMSPAPWRTAGINVRSTQVSVCCTASVEPNSRTLQRRILAQKEAK